MLQFVQQVIAGQSDRPSRGVGIGGGLGTAQHVMHRAAVGEVVPVVARVAKLIVKGPPSETIVSCEIVRICGVPSGAMYVIRRVFGGGDIGPKNWNVSEPATPASPTR